MARVFVLLASLLALLLAGCASGRAYENYTSWMQLQVGRSADDPNTYLQRYANLRVAQRQLPNGNVEEEFRSGRGGRCPTFFEISPQSRKIIGWRHEGSKEDCGIVP